MMLPADGPNRGLTSGEPRGRAAEGPGAIRRKPVFTERPPASRGDLRPSPRGAGPEPGREWQSYVSRGRRGCNKSLPSGNGSAKRLRGMARPRAARITAQTTAQTMAMSISPSPSIPPRIACPARTGPTPSGVPVMMRSPGSSATEREAIAMTSATGQIIRAISLS